MATHLLLVENEQALLDLLSRYLSRSEFQVTMASSAQVALDLLSTQVGNSVAFDIAIIDLNLSEGLTGLDLLGNLRDSGHSFPVLLYSGYPFAVETLAAHLQANVWFLQKPFLPRVLLEKVTTILEISATAN